MGDLDITHSPSPPVHSPSVFSHTAITLFGQMMRQDCNRFRLYKHCRNTEIWTVFPRPHIVCQQCTTIRTVVHPPQPLDTLYLVRIPTPHHSVAFSYNRSFASSGISISPLATVSLSISRTLSSMKRWSSGDDPRIVPYNRLGTSPSLAESLPVAIDPSSSCLKTKQ